jgi:hypothetical protein
MLQTNYKVGQKVKCQAWTELSSCGEKLFNPTLTILDMDEMEDIAGKMYDVKLTDGFTIGWFPEDSLYQ